MIANLNEEFNNKIESNWKLPNPIEKQQLLWEMKEKNKTWLTLFQVYRTPLDLWLMINDYLENIENKKEIPTLPWLLSHISISKKKKNEILEIWDEFSEVLQMWLLKIEEVLLQKWLSKKLDSRLLWMVLKNYHWLKDNVEITQTEKKEHTVNIIVKPALNEDNTKNINSKIIDMW